MGTEITHYGTSTGMALIGKIANQSASRAAFGDFQKRKATNTNRGHLSALALFSAYLKTAGLMDATDANRLQNDPQAWQGITWGIVEGFRQWMIQQGYAMGSVNGRLTTIKTYAKLAALAGAVDPTDMALIAQIKGYSRAEGKKVDEKRSAVGGRTRVGVKKSTPVRLTKAQADKLKAQPNTPQGRRDAVLMALLLDHGLRVGEVAILKVENFDLVTGKMTFHRPKVDKVQTHQLTADTLRALLAYVGSGDAPKAGQLLRGSRKGGALTDAGMTERAITKRVEVLGRDMFIGVEGLSAHDCRHYWATRAAEQGTDPFALQEAGGWTSLAMVRNYVEAAKIANSGVKL